MSRRLRLALALLGLVILCLAATALLYALWPVETLRDQLRLDPTLFAPPAP
jgi:hypothetical protein